nr:hypothetical protein [Brucella intermedia]
MAPTTSPRSERVVGAQLVKLAFSLKVNTAVADVEYKTLAVAERYSYYRASHADTA